MKNLLLLFFIAFLVSCVDKTSQDDTDLITEISIVTGIQLFDSDGVFEGSLGNPNVIVDSNVLSVYPTVSEETIIVRANDNIQNIWILNGDPTLFYQQIDYSTVVSSSTYSEEEIVSSLSFSYDASANNVTIGLSNLQKGFYRIFVKLADDKIHWQNVYVGTQEDEELNFWQ